LDHEEYDENAMLQTFLGVLRNMEYMEAMENMPLADERRASTRKSPG
jgi:hypothetical protein